MRCLPSPCQLPINVRETWQLTMRECGVRGVPTTLFSLSMWKSGWGISSTRSSSPPVRCLLLCGPLLFFPLPSPLLPSFLLAADSRPIHTHTHRQTDTYIHTHVHVHAHHPRGGCETSQTPPPPPSSGEVSAPALLAAPSPRWTSRPVCLIGRAQREVCVCGCVCSQREDKRKLFLCVFFPPPPEWFSSISRSVPPPSLGA